MSLPRSSGTGLGTVRLYLLAIEIKSVKSSQILEKLSGSLKLGVLGKGLSSGTQCRYADMSATLHDRARGLRSQGVSEEEIARYKHHHSSNAGIHRQRPEYKEALKDHPEVNRFMEWRKLHQVCQQA
ncbi:uncharacterized protein HaLaN_26057, partial [Haematococcus lacustris]